MLDGPPKFRLGEQIYGNYTKNTYTIIKIEEGITEWIYRFQGGHFTVESLIKTESAEGRYYYILKRSITLSRDGNILSCGQCIWGAAAITDYFGKYLNDMGYLFGVSFYTIVRSRIDQFTMTYHGCEYTVEAIS